MRKVSSNTNLWIIFSLLILFLAFKNGRSEPTEEQTTAETKTDQSALKKSQDSTNQKIEEEPKESTIRETPKELEDQINHALTIHLESTTTKKPESTTTRKPESTTTKKPESTTTKKPESTTTKKPESTTTKKPESTTTRKPDSTTTKKPESTTTKKPESTTTKKPESTTTKRSPTTASTRTITTRTSTKSVSLSAGPYFTRGCPYADRKRNCLSSAKAAYHAGIDFCTGEGAQYLESQQSELINSRRRCAGTCRCLASTSAATVNEQQHEYPISDRNENIRPTYPK